MTERRARRTALVVAALLAPAAAGAVEGVIYSGSAYVDYWGIPEKSIAAASPQGVAPMASLRIGIDVNDDLSFTTKACISCHGIDAEQIALDYQPKSWFNVQFGRISVPFGEFSNRVDPGSYKTASPPLIYDMGRMAFGSRSAMNLGVLPLPYVDTGALVYGVRWLGEKIQVWYGVYGVAGLRGSNDLDWMAMRSIPYNDNNRVPAGGGRLALSYSANPGAFFGDANLGGSYTTGRYDKDATRSYEMLRELDGWGVKFEKDATGDYAVKKVHHMGSYVLPMPEGHAIKKVLFRQLRKAGVETTNRLTATRVLLHDGRV